MQEPKETNLTEAALGRLNQTSRDWHGHRGRNGGREAREPAGVGATGRSPLQTVRTEVYESFVVRFSRGSRPALQADHDESDPPGARLRA
jgi:hypothetical protein